MNLLGLLHSKTTYFREMDISEYKSIYEDISSKLEDLNKYYTNLINSIENDIYMSPSGYFIARNISNVFGATQYCQKELEKWYKYIKDNPKKREVMIHNNPDLNHLVRNDNLYLLSWDKAKSDMPIYDLYNFYKNSHTYLDYNELLKIYENKYPLHDEEKRLLFILLAIPDKIILEDNEYENCKKAKKIFDYLYKVYHLTAPYHTPPEKEEAADLND
jgi:hypothetical protein